MNRSAVALLVAVVLSTALPACSADSGPSLIEGCTGVTKAYGSIIDSLGLASETRNPDGARVHLDAAADGLKALQAVKGPAGEFTRLQDDLAGATSVMLTRAGQVVDAIGLPEFMEPAKDDLDVATAEAQQALLRMRDLCAESE